MSSSPNRIVATIFGAVYLLVGLLGFAVTGGVGFIANEVSSRSTRCTTSRTS